MLERRIERKVLMLALGLCIATSALIYSYSDRRIVIYIFAGFAVGAVNLHVMIKSVIRMRKEGARSVVAGYFIRYGIIAAAVIVAAMGGVNSMIATVGGIASVYAALFAVGISGWN